MPKVTVAEILWSHVLPGVYVGKVPRYIRGRPSHVSVTVLRGESLWFVVILSGKAPQIHLKGYHSAVLAKEAAARILGYVETNERLNLK